MLWNLKRGAGEPYMPSAVEWQIAPVWKNDQEPSTLELGLVPF